MKVALYMMGEKGMRCLEGLEYEMLPHIARVVVGNDPNVTNDYSDEILVKCADLGLNCTTNENLQDDINIIIAISWRKLIQVGSHQKLVVLHDSILPRYRGFNPLVTALINGDSEIGVTAIYGAETYDTGAIISLEKRDITYPIKIAEAISIISKAYSVLLNRVLEKLLMRDFDAIPQNNEAATYSIWRDDEDYFIDWNNKADAIARKIDAVGTPYDGAKFRWINKIYKIEDATALKDIMIENRVVGKNIFKQQGKPVIICGEGLLRLDKVIGPEGELETFTNKFRIRLK